MNCTKIEKLLPLYTQADLSPREMESVSAHLLSCDDCRTLSEEFAASQERLRNFAVPEFGAEFYAELRGAVMKEISKSPHPARPSIFRSLFDFFPRRTALAASLATLALFGLLSFALYLSLLKSRAMLPAVERSMAELNPVLLPEDGTSAIDTQVKSNGTDARRPRTFAVKSVPRRSGPEVKRGVRPDLSAPESIDSAASTVAETVAQTSAAPPDEAQGQAVARMDIQTSDPNIRIIWLARKAGE